MLTGMLFLLYLVLAGYFICYMPWKVEKRLTELEKKVDTLILWAGGQIRKEEKEKQEKK